MELWDVYDRNRVKKGKLAIRGEGLEPGEYHLVVHIWIVNSRGEYLIQKRAPGVVGSPNMWAMTGGSAIAGDDSKAACIREMKEEIGVEPDMRNARVVFTVTRDDSICDIWLIHQEFEAGECVLQEEEVSAVKWASAPEIRLMAEQGSFINYFYLEDLFAASAPTGSV